MEARALRERRGSVRVPYAIKLLILHENDAWLADAMDLSEGGCGVFRPPGCPLSDGNVVRLLFIETSGPVVSVSARIAWVTARHMGIEYHEAQSVPPTAAR